jgi:hypothetical protein
MFLSPTAVLPALLGCLSAFVTDFVTRQKLGGADLSYFVYRQLPILRPRALELPQAWLDGLSIGNWLADRAMELTFTSLTLAGFAAQFGYAGPPFRWALERRFLLRCELDAAFFHLYGIDRDDVDYIMDTFPIVCRKDEAAHGEYRTKRVILEIYDAMAKAIESGEPYQTLLDPPPAHDSMRHPDSAKGSA